MKTKRYFEAPQDGQRANPDLQESLIEETPTSSKEAIDGNGLNYWGQTIKNSKVSLITKNRISQYEFS